MTKGSKRLRPIANLAKQNERSAARLHGSVLNESKKQEQQLEELIKYRDEYLVSFKAAGKAGITVMQMQEYRIFLTRLDDAIKQQQQNVFKAQQDSVASKDQWLDKRNKSKMINKVVESRQKVEIDQKEKREQREIEDRPFIKQKFS